MSCVSICYADAGPRPKSVFRNGALDPMAIVPSLPPTGQRQNSRRFALCQLGIAFVMLAAVVRAAGADPEAHDAAVLLRRVAATYQSAIDYEVEVESKVVSIPWNSTATSIKYVLAASRPRLMFTEAKVIEPIVDDVRLGAEDCSAWAYAPKKRRYVIDGYCAGIADELRRQHFRLFRRFETLDSMDLTAQVTRSERQSDGEHKVRCVVLRLRPRTGGDWTEHLWVDDRRCVVLKSVMEVRRLFETIVTTSTWRKLRIGIKIEPTVFRFIPPSDASETNWLNIP
jgi:hypothetical protein